MLWQTFHSPLLAGFAVISHWLPFLFLSVYFGALADRYDSRRVIQVSQALFMLVSIAWGVLFLTNQLQVWQAMLLLVNSRTEHVRFRYMHMSPEKLDADGMVHGRRVAEGEKVGVVSNYQGFQGGTTTHLHFDLQVFTRDGWVWVNPYSTLIVSYERLLGARGREIGPDLSAPPPITSVSQTPQPEPPSSEGVEDGN